MRHKSRHRGTGALPWLAAALMITGAAIAAPASAVSPTLTPTYSATKGDLKVVVSGMPTGVKATVTVTKSGKALARTATATRLYSNLATGTYTVTALNVSVTKGTMVPSPKIRTITVVKNKVVSAPMKYVFVGQPVAVTSKVNGKTPGWTFTSTATTMAITVTNASKKRALTSFTIVVPTGVPAPTNVKVAASNARQWTATVVSCGSVTKCVKRIVVTAKTPLTTNRLAYAQKAIVTLKFTSPSVSGTSQFLLRDIGAGYFTVSGSQASLRTVKGTSIAATPGTPITDATIQLGTNPDNTVSTTLDNGAYGPVNLYYEPATCSNGAAPPCATVTLDGTFTNPVAPFDELYSNTAPASISFTCANATCPQAPWVGQVSSGRSHACAVMRDGTSATHTHVECWGNNDYGQLGRSTNFGTQNPNPTPTAVPGVTGVTQVAAGWYDTCALKTDTTVVCWGDNSDLQLGAPTSGTESIVPVVVPDPVSPSLPLSGVIAIVPGPSHTCAVKNDNTAVCWGSNWHGQLGISAGNGFPSQHQPPTVVPLSGVTSVALGTDHTCALLTDNTVMCWGSNANGQLGNAANAGTTTTTIQPLSVLDANSTPIGPISSISSGAEFTCAAMTDTSHTVQCWGNNATGQLGVTPFTTGPAWTNIPVSVMAEAGDFLGGVQEISANSAAVGEGQVCARVTGGTLACWGANDAGQLAQDATVTILPAARPLSTPTGVTQLSMGGSFACTTLLTLGISCWGLNDFGQLGRIGGAGSMTPNPTPTVIPGWASERRLADYYAYPISVSLKVGGSYHPFATTPACAPIDGTSNQTGQLFTTAAQSAHFCADVWDSSRSWEPHEGILSRTILFVEDPKFTPISR